MSSRKTGIAFFLLFISALAAGAQVLPRPGGPSQITGVSGDGHSLATTSGALTQGHVIVPDATGNLVDSGSPPGNGGSTLSAPVVRGSGIQASSATSYTVTLPAGTLAGDLAIIFDSAGYNPPVPECAGAATCISGGSGTLVGWTILNYNPGTNLNGATYAKVLNSADITAGSITVTNSNTFDSTVAIVTFVGPTGGVRNTITNRSTGPSSPVVLSSDGTSLATDYFVYFAGTRAAATVACSVGTQLKVANDAGSASGVLCGGIPGNTGGITQSFSFTSISSAYPVIVEIKGS